MRNPSGRSRVPQAHHGHPAARGTERRGGSAYAALDLGTNNCRLLIAEPVHFGFRVIDDRTYTLTPRDGTERYIHDLVLARADGKTFDMAALGPAVETGLLAVWEGRAESDGLNALVLTAGLGWHDAALLRALSRYLRQIGTSYSQRYIAQVLVTRAWRLAPAGVLAPFDYAGIVLAVLYGYLWFKEEPSWTVLLGLPLVIGSGLYILHLERIRARERGLEALA